MSYLAEFADFVKSTGPLYLNGPEMIVNDSALRNYATQDLLLRTKREVQGGTTIKCNIVLDQSSDAVHYLPGEIATISNSAYLSTMESPWRFTRIDVPFNEKEITLNEGSSREARFQQYTRIMTAKLMGKMTDITTKIERSLVAAATTDMETANGRTPASIFLSVTSDGLAPSGLTTVQQLNPTTKTKWRNQTGTYTYSAPYDRDTGVIAGFDNMAEKVRFVAPAKGGKDFTASSMDEMVVLTNKEGLVRYRKAVRANNDFTRAGAQDPAYNGAVYNGTAIRTAEAFDDQATFTSGQPGYMFLNGKFLHVICRAGKWMTMSPKLTPHNIPDTTVYYLDCWWNLVNESRARQGYLSAA